jgi:hypothetical protein
LYLESGSAFSEVSAKQIISREQESQPFCVRGFSMSPNLVLALLIASSTPAMVDGSQQMPDPTQFRTDDDQRFEVALKGITGVRFEGRVDISPGQTRCFQTASSEGGDVLVVVKLHTGTSGDWLVEVKILDALPTGRMVTRAFSLNLPAGESQVGGKGWNSLVEVRLSEK